MKTKSEIETEKTLKKMNDFFLTCGKNEMSYDEKEVGQIIMKTKAAVLDFIKKNKLKATRIDNNDYLIRATDLISFIRKYPKLC